MSDVDEMLGIDRDDPLQQLAADIVSNSDSFVESLKQHRLERGLSPEAVAKRMGTTEASVRGFEQGSLDVTLSFIRRYLHATRLLAGYAIVSMDEAA